MPAYTIIRVEEEIARHYFQKSDLLYRFLMSYKYDQNKDYLNRQYSYITKYFVLDEIIHRLEDMNWHHTKFERRGYGLEISTDKNDIALHVSKKHIKFCCDTMQDAEALLFPALRKIHPYLFVVCDDYVNYGWVSPILNKEQIQKQVLYSQA